jgi:amino acid transporter
MINFLPVRAFGELEYIIGWIKISFISLLIVFNIIINVHSFDSALSPTHFKYYDSPYGFQSQNFTVHGHVYSGGVGHLAGMWTSMTTVVFGMAGFDAVAIAAAETKNLERDESIKLATRKITLRVVTLYALATFVVGLNVPYTDPNLKIFAINSLPNGQHSIFIIAAVRAHLTGWPHFFNAFYIFSATSAGINALYLASRLLHALACSPNAWPGWHPFEVIRTRLQRTIWGVPSVAVCTSFMFGLLGFLAVKPSAAQVSFPQSYSTTAA